MKDENTFAPLPEHARKMLDAAQERLTQEYARGRRDAKHEYFEKIKSLEFWKAVVTDDGPEGIEYAKKALACIKQALEEA